MSNRKNYKLLEKIIEELNHEEVKKVLSIFKVNKGSLVLTEDGIMLDHDGVISNHNRIDTVSIKDFTITVAKKTEPVKSATKEEEITPGKSDGSIAGSKFLKDNK